MRTGIAISTAWMAATLVAVVVAAAAVGNVRAQVTEGPTALSRPASLEVEAASQAALAADPPAEVLPETDTVVKSTEQPVVTTTTIVEVVETPTITEVGSDNNATTSTTQPAQTTTTAASSYTKTYNVTVDGVTAGTVRVEVAGETVSFSGATVSPGWTFELKENGPKKVEVKFKFNDDEDVEIKVEVKLDDGELEINTSEDH